MVRQISSKEEFNPIGPLSIDELLVFYAEPSNQGPLTVKLRAIFFNDAFYSAGQIA